MGQKCILSYEVSHVTPVQGVRSPLNSVFFSLETFLRISSVSISSNHAVVEFESCVNMLVDVQTHELF